MKQTRQHDLTVDGLPAVGARGVTSPITEDEKLEQLYGLISRGCTIASACAVVGIKPRTYRAWREKGRELLAAEEEGRDPTCSHDPELADRYKEFYQRSTSAEGAFDARLDVELAKRIDTMETRDLIRLRELRARSWQPKADVTVKHSNDPHNPMPSQTHIQNAQIISFTPAQVGGATQTLIEAGIIDVDGEEMDDGEA